MKTRVIVLGLAALLIGASAYAGGDSDRCTRTTRRCGTETVKPSEGYEGQRCEKDSRTTRHSRRCGGCGKQLPDAETNQRRG